jgi:hypothetical protein
MPCSFGLVRRMRLNPSRSVRNGKLRRPIEPVNFLLAERLFGAEVARRPLTFNSVTWRRENLRIEVGKVRHALRRIAVFPSRS